MARKKKAPKHVVFQESYEQHKSVGSFAGGSCLTGHKSKWEERDSCSYRWQGIAKAKENSGPYHSYKDKQGKSINRLDGSDYGWVAVSALSAGAGGKVLQSLHTKQFDKTLKQLVKTRNFTNGFAPYANQVHHVLPNSALYNGVDQATASNTALIKVIGDGLLKEKYNINFKDNMLILPRNWRDACKVGLPTHCGDHPTYTATVQGRVMKALQPYAAVADEGEDHDEPDYEDLKDELEEISRSTYTSVVKYGQSAILSRCGDPKTSVNALPQNVAAGLF
jgi:hypothetical protein